MIRTWSLRSVFLGLMAIVTSGSLSYAADEKGWINLFNGKDLTGWIQKGGMAKYRIENDEIVGSSVPNTANSFLCTTKDYGNFILEVEFKVHPDLNSGVQIRSQVFEEAKTAEIKGKTYKFAAGRVHGYQVEIDPSARAYSAGIYDEGRRLWLIWISKIMKLHAKRSSQTNGINSGSNARVIRSRLSSMASLLQISKMMSPPKV